MRSPVAGVLTLLLAALAGHAAMSLRTAPGPSFRPGATGTAALTPAAARVISGDDTNGVFPSGSGHLIVPARGGCSVTGTGSLRTEKGEVGRVRPATLPEDACTPPMGRPPAAWARTPLVSGRPTQLIWALLHDERLPNLLATLPHHWADVQVAFSFVDPNCVTDCDFVFTMLAAAAALDIVTDPPFGRQTVVAPLELPGHHLGDCLTMSEFLEGVESSAPITENGRMAAVAATLKSVTTGPARQMQCTQGLET